MKQMMDCPAREFPPRRRMAWPVAVAGLLVLAACSTPGGGYGLSGRAATEAALRQQAADKADKTDKAAVPDDQEMYLSLIREMQAQGLYFASLAHIAAYQQKYGASPDIDLLRADALRETGQAEAADAAYRQLLPTPMAAAAWHGLGLLAGQRKDFAAAVPALREASRRDPVQPFFLNDLGYALLRAGDVALARVPIAQAAELAPGNRKIIGNLALYLLVSGDKRRADAVMDQAQLPKDTRQAVACLAQDIARQPKPRARAAVRPAPVAPVTVAATAPVVVRLPDRGTPPSPGTALAGTDISHASPSNWPMQPVLDRFSRTP